MDSGLWTFLAAVVGFGTVIVEQGRARRRMKRVEAQTEPTSNGFAKEVQDSLARLEVQVADVDEKLDEHLRDHVRGSILRG